MQKGCVLVQQVLKYSLAAAWRICQHTCAGLFWQGRRKEGSLQSWLISKILPLYFIISVGEGHVGSRHALFLLVVLLQRVLDPVHL